MQETCSNNIFLCRNIYNQAISSFKLVNELSLQYKYK